MRLALWPLDGLTVAHSSSVVACSRQSLTFLRVCGLPAAGYVLAGPQPWVRRDRGRLDHWSRPDLWGTATGTTVRPLVADVSIICSSATGVPTLSEIASAWRCWRSFSLVAQPGTRRGEGAVDDVECEHYFQGQKYLADVLHQVH